MTILARITVEIDITEGDIMFNSIADFERTPSRAIAEMFEEDVYTFIIERGRVRVTRLVGKDAGVSQTFRFENGAPV